MKVTVRTHAHTFTMTSIGFIDILSITACESEWCFNEVRHLHFNIQISALGIESYRIMDGHIALHWQQPQQVHSPLPTPSLSWRLNRMVPVSPPLQLVTVEHSQKQLEVKTITKELNRSKTESVRGESSPIPRCDTSLSWNANNYRPVRQDIKWNYILMHFLKKYIKICCEWSSTPESSVS